MLYKHLIQLITEQFIGFFEASSSQTTTTDCQPTKRWLEDVHRAIIVQPIIHQYQCDQARQGWP